MTNQLIISSFELILSLIIGILCLYIAHYIIVRIFTNRFNNQDPYENNAFLIFLAGILFSVGYLISGVMTPLSTTIDMLNNGDFTTSDSIIAYSKYIILFCSLGLVLAGLINFLTYLLFSSLTTNLNELEEINNGNVGVSILVSVIAIVISILCREPFLIVLESFIPYPEIPQIF
jgi:uncharacterized membrane protein YjfL (UPF0719 family)